MNLPIFLKILESLIPVTDQGVSGKALALKQRLELLANNPNAGINLQQAIQMVAALQNVSDQGVGPAARDLLHSLVELMKQDPTNPATLNLVISSAACFDWPTFNQIAAFVARVLTQGNPQLMPQAVQQFERICRETLPAAA